MGVKTDNKIDVLQQKGGSKLCNSTMQKAYKYSYVQSLLANTGGHQNITVSSPKILKNG
jgi:hypothetical protein